MMFDWRTFLKYDLPSWLMLLPVTIALGFMLAVGFVILLPWLIYELSQRPIYRCDWCGQWHLEGREPLYFPLGQKQDSTRVCAICADDLP